MRNFNLIIIFWDSSISLTESLTMCLVSLQEKQKTIKPIRLHKSARNLRDVENNVRFLQSLGLPQQLLKRNLRFVKQSHVSQISDFQGHLKQNTIKSFNFILHLETQSGTQKAV